MSVATEFAPTVDIPPRALSHVPSRRPVESELPLATVSVLRAPRDVSAAAPLRLTRRGVAVLTSVVVALGGALVWLAAVSATASAGGAAAAGAAAPARVVVRAGDTLWSIAARVAPGRDPRAEVADLQRINHLATPDLVPGESLRTR